MIFPQNLNLSVNMKSFLKLPAFNSLMLLMLYLCFSPSLLTDLRAQEADTTHAFENEIIAFEQSDKQNPPPENAILFTGSSSVRMWKSLQDDYPNYQVFNRGFGGSQFGDLLQYMDRIVLPYQPRKIFVYEGDNDVNAGVAPAQILEDFETFVSRIKQALPETEIVFISIKPSPSRAGVFDKMKEANGLIRNYAQHTAAVAYADVFNPMLDQQNNIRTDLFLEDELHMNAKGYDIWERAIRPYLD
jgi:lysophospholipase L1-like esterase